MTTPPPPTAALPPRLPTSPAGSPPSLWTTSGRPRHVPWSLAATGLALVAGLLLPVLQTETLLFWEDSYSILVGTLALFEDGHVTLALTLLVFSVLFPAAKLVALAWLWFRPLEHHALRRGVWWTSTLGKWSMLDVFVVAVFIVLTTSSSLVDARPRAGLFVFGLAVLLSMAASLEIEFRQARLEQQRDG